MITPDGIGHEKRRPKSGHKGLLGAAVSILSAGLIALGVLASPEPAAVESSTTTSVAGEIDAPVDLDDFTVAQIARGEALSWERSMSVDDAFPIALLDHDDALYLFATQRPNFSGFKEGGLRAWRSTDGQRWESLGRVIAERRVITAVSSTGAGLVALERGNTGSGFAVWQSSNGSDWVREEIAAAGAGGELVAMRPISVGGTEDLLVVSGIEELQVSGLIAERLGEQFSDSIDLSPYGWSVEVTFNDQIFFRLYGPVGLPLATITADDLALTGDEKELVEEAYERGGRWSTWVRTEDGWSSNVIRDAEVVQWVGTIPDGRVIATGYGSGGLTTWATRDGSSWAKLSSFSGPVRVDDWGDRVVGPAPTSGASVVASDGEGGWEEIGPAAYFPDDLDWSVSGLGAGNGGVAVVLNGWGGSRRVTSPAEPPTLTRSGASLVLEFNSGVYSLEVDGETHRWSMGGEGPNGIEADLEAGTLSFNHPETGERLATFDFEEINHAAHEYWSQQGSRGHVQAFAFTDGSGSWSIQDLSDLGEQSAASLLEVTDSRVVLVGTDSDPFVPTSSAGFAVWSAEIPSDGTPSPGSESRVP